jgi:hypothetical protein
MTTQKPETDISDPFSQFETAGEILEFVFRQCTADGLRQLFTFDETKQFHREFLEDAAAELAQAGMLSASAIVTSAAKGAPIQVEVCPYEEGSTNHKAWLATMKRRLTNGSRR